MKYALISPDQPAISYNGELFGERICEVAQRPFDVAEPLFWVECDDNVRESDFYYTDGQILPLPQPPVSDPIPIPVVDQVGPNVVA